MDRSDRREIVETSFQRKGSLRRVLPSSPQGDSLLNVSAKMVSNSKLSTFPRENYSPFFLEYNLISEFNMVARFREKYSGVYVIPSAESGLGKIVELILRSFVSKSLATNHLSRMVWFGVIFVRSGMYEGGALRFEIHFTDQFPNDGAPRLVFEQSLFHPAVDEVTRDFAVRSFFPEWKKDVNHVYQVLVILKQILHCVDARSFHPVHTKAAELYARDKVAFQKRVKQDVQKSQETLCNISNSDPHFITFSQFDPEIHKDVLTVKEPKSEPINISWVQPGSLEPFSKPHY